MISMKKTTALVLSALLALSGCAKNPDDALTPVTLNEVAHSIFYAPQYAAIELGYFKDQGIDLSLVNGAGADKVMTALVSGDADIGFMGSEASIYTYAQGAEDYAVNFAQLTQRAGNFLAGAASAGHSGSHVKFRAINRTCLIKKTPQGKTYGVFVCRYQCNRNCHRASPESARAFELITQRIA